MPGVPAAAQSLARGPPAGPVDSVVVAAVLAAVLAAVVARLLKNDLVASGAALPIVADVAEVARRGYPGWPLAHAWPVRRIPWVRGAVGGGERRMDIA